MKAIADDKINVIQKLNFDIGRVENIVGKGENTGYQHFLLFLQCFQKPSISRLLKVGIVWERVTSLPNNKILDWFKLKAFADNKLHVAKIMISVFDSVENIVGKEKMPATSIFSFSHNVFKRLLSQGQ